MRKKKIALLFIICLCLSLSGCSRDDEMTLHLSYGDRTGTYSGEVNDEGIPHGIGKFSSQNPEGVKWVYEGNFVNGHFEGEGKTTWEDGEIEIGTYKDDTIIPMTGKEIKNLYKILANSVLISKQGNTHNSQTVMYSLNSTYILCSKEALLMLSC